MTLSFLEWNLHAMGGKNYSIPQFVPEYLISKNADIIVLTEFRSDERFMGVMGKDYNLYFSPACDLGYNQVCIALRKEAKITIEKLVTEDVGDIKIPEYLQLDVCAEEKRFSIIGTRIKTQSDTKEKQYKFLKRRLEGLSTAICLGDFNCTSTTLRGKMGDKLEVHGPRIRNGYYSFVFKNSDTQGLDWLIATEGIKVTNPYADKGMSPFASYDWGFISHENGYGDKTKADYLGIHGLPDHAILMGQIEV